MYRNGRGSPYYHGAKKKQKDRNPRIYMTREADIEP
jgi:hypothetical protein